MELTNVPASFPLYWGQNAGGSYIRNIPVNSQIGIQNGAASLNDGFPPDTFQPAGAGGVPPFGQDFNGILRQLSQWSQWANAGAPVVYDSTFSSGAGGYPAGALLRAASLPVNWVSLVDNNTSDPDSGGANWIAEGGGSATVASASTVDLSTTWASLVNITGTTAITAFGTLPAGITKTLVFGGVLTLTYNATSLLLPGAANITTAAGDVAVMKSLGSGNWQCVVYQRASGQALVPASAGSIANSQLANMAAKTVKGNATASPASPADLTQTQLTALVNPVVGDSGSGGTLGAVPAPAAGDAADGKALMASGGWGYPGIGVGQSWQNVSRSVGTAYQNTTGRTIFVSATSSNTTSTLSVSVDGSTYITISSTEPYYNGYIGGPIPPGNYYKISGNVLSWTELR